MRKWLFSTAAVVAILSVVLFAQEARRIPGGFIITGGGNAGIGTGDVVFEGATGDANELTLTVADPGSDVTVTIQAATDTLVGLATTDTLTNKTLTGPTLTAPTLTGGTIGKDMSRVSFRQEFDEPCFKKEAADFTAELVVDAAVNLAICGGPGLNHFEYRLDGDQASPFIVIGGALDIDNDAASNEGVEIVAADTSNSTQGWIVTGTSPAMYTRASISIASVSGTDNLYFGWKIAGAFVDQMVLATINTGGFFNIDDNAGNIEIVTLDDTALADDEADINPTWIDAETIVLEVRMSTAGVFTFFQDGTAVTIDTAIGAAAAGDIMVPVIAYEATADADAEVTINYWEVGEVI